MAQAKFTASVSAGSGARKRPSKRRRGQHNILGNRGEFHACKYLQKKGYRLVRKNWKCKAGEIDLIFYDEDTLVFVEVKSRRDSSRASKYICDNVDYPKQKKLRLLVEIYLKAHWPDCKHPPPRIDVLAVLFDKSGYRVSSVEHLIAAV